MCRINKISVKYVDYHFIPKRVKVQASRQPVYRFLFCRKDLNSCHSVLFLVESGITKVGCKKVDFNYQKILDTISGLFPGKMNNG